MTLTGYKALIHDPQYRILFLEDSFTRDGKQTRFLDLPGGKPEGDEQPRETVKREVKEETGLDVLVQQCVGTYEIATKRGTIVCEVYAAIPESYAVDINANPATDEKILSYAWLTIDEAIGRTMSPSLRRFLRSVR